MQWVLLIILIPYIYLLLKIYNNLYRIKPREPGITPDQFVSVIVACHNEEKDLPYLLHDISMQNYNQELFEVIIVDDHSTDTTYEIANGYTAIRNIKVIKNNNNGKKQAIRTGVAASLGNLIITTDADCRIGENWISTITSFFDQQKPDLIICPVVLESSCGFFHRFQELEYLSLQGVTAGTAERGNPVMCNGANMAFSKESYNKNSGNLHDEIASGDDVFLLHSIKKEPGNKILWLESQNAIVTTRSTNEITSYFKQRVRWISKAGAYKDPFTRVLAIVTFITILLMLFLLFAGLINPVFLPVLLAAFFLKSIPDFLVLRNTARRYNKRSLLGIFLPAQIIYPFYVIAVFFCFLVAKKQV
jgi:biofilm PGA synthesis N-glycosyltransferase PgaC